jgi:hypothetical protein
LVAYKTDDRKTKKINATTAVTFIKQCHQQKILHKKNAIHIEQHFFYALYILKPVTER